MDFLPWKIKLEIKEIVVLGKATLSDCQLILRLDMPSNMLLKHGGGRVEVHYSTLMAD